MVCFLNYNFLQNLDLLTSEGKYLNYNTDVVLDFPHKDNKLEGAIEIFKMPEKNSEGKVFGNRYIIGHDPVDNDQAESSSLSSTFEICTSTVGIETALSASRIATLV